MNVSAFCEPFTPRGVAAFARVKTGRLLLAQLIFACLAAVATAYFFHNACFPVVLAAIDNLPADGQIRSGQLAWNGAPQMLAEGRFIAFDVDLDHSDQISSTADLRIEFGQDTVRVYSLFGYTDFFYPSGETLSFNRPELEPLWKAWRAIILFFIAALTILLLMMTWSALATIYFLPVWLLGFLTNRDLDLRASWKLSGAALLPGALLMIPGILLYAFNFLGLISFCFIFAAHFILGWLYLIFGLFFLPRLGTAAPKENPFNTANPPQKQTKTNEKQNPFSQKPNP